MVWCGVISVLVLAVSVALLVHLPWVDYLEEERVFQQIYDNLTTKNEYSSRSTRAFNLPVMSFNVRLDGWERDVNNHFTKRMPRMDTTIRNWRPALIGLQEPYGGQMSHMMSYLPHDYRVIGKHDTHGSRPQQFQLTNDDFQVAILYDSKRLTLVEHDYIHLSKNPRLDYSKDWNSEGVRTLNIARFKVIGTAYEVLAFNTHLDSRSEEARRSQSLVLANTINEWKSRYPQAIVVLTGDFNAAPGQMAHSNIITRATLKDAWEDCKALENEGCPSNDVAVSFHGWHGSRANTFASRILNGILFTLHAMGMKLPHHVPTSWSDLRDLLTNSARLETSYALYESLPSHPWSNLHVDWILYGSSPSVRVEPKFMFVGDVRDSDFSSDHFPLVSVLQLSTNLPQQKRI